MERVEMLNFSKNSKLKDRILWGYSVPIGLSVLAATLVYFNVQKAIHQTELVEDAHLVLDDVKDLAFDIQSIQRTTRGYLIQKSETSLNAYEEATKEFDELAENLRKEVKDAEQQKKLAEIIEL